jgi:hypothetical protein
VAQRHEAVQGRADAAGEAVARQRQVPAREQSECEERAKEEV